MTVRVRFAPAPSGRKHIGNYRTALFNWLFARSQGGEMVLRFEDTDQSRSSVGAEVGITDTMSWLGLDFDAGPFRQSDRTSHYLEAARLLEETGHAYRCWCTPEEIDAKRKQAQAEGRAPVYDRTCRQRDAPGDGPSVLRFAMPTEGRTVVHDLVRGEVVFEHEHLSDPVLVRADGTPLYVLAVVVDDTEMGITHVLRGEDLLSNTPWQILISVALGRTDPVTFGHLPLIVGADHAKLSTRHGPVALEDYRDDGFLPEAAVNYMAMLGWSFPEGREVFTLGEAREVFDLSRVGKTPATFDVKKFESVNFEWIQRLSDDELVDRALPFFEKQGFGPVDRELLRSTVSMFRTRVRKLSQIPAMVGFLFQWPGYDESAWVKVMTRDRALELLDASTAIIEGAAALDVDRLSIEHMAMAEKLGVKPAVAFGPPRVAMTGSNVGPPLWESIVLLGRDESLARLGAARARLVAEQT